MRRPHDPAWELVTALSSGARRAACRGTLLLWLGALCAASAPACGSADSDNGSGTAGTGAAGRGGSASGGTGGNAGASGATAGTAGRSGAGGAAGTAGGGSGGSSGAGASGGSGGNSGTGGNAGTGAAAGRGGGGAATDAGSPDSGRGGNDAGGSGGNDAGPTMDGPTPIDVARDGAGGASPDGGTCVPVDPNDATIMGYESDIVSRLAGQTEITPGVKLANRATTASRQTARDYLKKVFQDIGLTPLEQNYGSGTNVYAELPSTTGGTQAVVLGAHYDTVMVAPGANDNATGVAAVFAVARYAAQLSCRSKPLIFVLFDEEEVGLVGSKQFATKLKNDGRTVHSVHTIDQMGWDSNNDRLIELELPDTGLRELYEAAVAKLGVTIPMVTTTTSSTDHASFRPTFLAIGLTEGYKSGDTTPYYHKAGDTFDTVNFAYLLSSTALINQVFADLTR